MAARQIAGDEVPSQPAQEPAAGTPVAAPAADTSPRAVFIKNSFVNQVLRFPGAKGGTYQFPATKVEIRDAALIAQIRKVADKYHIIEEQPE
jgi:hypothetical protein